MNRREKKDEAGKVPASEPPACRRPANYDDNLIDVTGLKGCHLFRQLADPGNQLSELNERNNVGRRRLLPTGDATSIRFC